MQQQTEAAVSEEIEQRGRRDEDLGKAARIASTAEGSHAQRQRSEQHVDTAMLQIVRARSTMCIDVAASSCFCQSCRQSLPFFT